MVNYITPETFIDPREQGEAPSPFALFSRGGAPPIDPRAGRGLAPVPVERSAYVATEIDPRRPLPPAQAPYEPELQPSDPVSELAARSAVPRRQLTPRQQNQEEYDELARDENPEDENGRWASMGANALDKASRNAQAVLEGSLRSGRPVDMYGIAAILGGAGGGAAAAAVKPNVDERQKREYRMQTLEQMIGKQLQVERADAQLANDAEELRLRGKQIEQTGELQREGLRQRSKPKPFVLAGQRINYRWSAENEDWEPYAEEVDGKPLVDASKVADPNGLLPWQAAQLKSRKDLTETQIKAHADLARENNKFRGEENEKQREQRQREHADKLKLGWAGYQARISSVAEQVRHNLAGELQQRSNEAGRQMRARVSYEKAKKMAEIKGVSLPDFIDILSDEGVEVTK